MEESATACQLARTAGASLLGHSRSVVRNKGDVSNVVTEADLEAERLIVAGLRRHFPDDAIIAEETGVRPGSSGRTWIVDPLDGTSNFVAGIPWFGVMIALLESYEPILGIMYLPAGGELYFAERGKGAYLNERQIHVTGESQLEKVLWACGMDGSTDEFVRDAQSALVQALAGAVRNLRMTNCLLDAAFTADGRIGGMVNFSTRIWDIAAPSLIVREAGGLYTNLEGTNLQLDLSASACEREYAVVAGAAPLHAKVLQMIKARSICTASA